MSFPAMTPRNRALVVLGGMIIVLVYLLRHRQIGGGVQDEGQLLGTTPFGQLLKDLAKKPEVKLFLEVGTWKGGGSTRQIAQGLKESKKDGLLITIEGNVEFWLNARELLKDYPVKCLLGTEIDPEELPLESDFKEGDLGWAVMKEMLPDERKMAALYETGLIKSLCEKRSFDAALLDGGEFAGPVAFRDTMKYCKTLKYLALHDISTYKNKAAVEELKKDKQWELVETDDNWYAVFKRK